MPNFPVTIVEESANCLSRFDEAILMPLIEKYNFKIFY